MFFSSPQYFHRDCKLCKEFCLDENGQPLKDVTGEKIKQSEKHTCKGCPKENFKNGWEYGNEWLFKMYMVGRAFGKLPRAGGVAQQPADLIEMFFYLYLIEQSAKRAEGQRSLQGILPILGVMKNG